MVKLGCCEAEENSKNSFDIFLWTLNRERIENHWTSYFTTGHFDPINLCYSSFSSRLPISFINLSFSFDSLTWSRIFLHDKCRVEMIFFADIMRTISDRHGSTIIVLSSFSSPEHLAINWSWMDFICRFSRRFEKKILTNGMRNSHFAMICE